MFQKTPSTFVNAAPSTIDSLKSSLKNLHIKVDSLQKISERAEVRGEFFSDVISQDLYMFSTIIIIAGLVSWAFVAGVLRLHKLSVEKSTNKMLKIENSKLSDRISEIEDNLITTNYDVHRAMYFKVLKDEDWPNAFDWALACAVSLNKYKDRDNESLTYWVLRAESALNNLSVGDASLVSGVNLLTESLNELSNNSEELKLKCDEVLKKLNHLVYTIPQPPDDLFQSPSDTP